MIKYYVEPFRDLEVLKLHELLEILNGEKINLLTKHPEQEPGKREDGINPTLV